MFSWLLHQRPSTVFAVLASECKGVGFPPLNRSPAVWKTAQCSHRQNQHGKQLLKRRIESHDAGQSRDCTAAYQLICCIFDSACSPSAMLATSYVRLFSSHNDTSQGSWQAQHCLPKKNMVPEACQLICGPFMSAWLASVDSHSLSFLQPNQKHQNLHTGKEEVAYPMFCSGAATLFVMCPCDVWCLM